MKFSIKDFFSKSDRIRRRLRIWSHLLKRSLMENCIFCAVLLPINISLKAKFHDILETNVASILKKKMIMGNKTIVQ